MFLPERLLRSVFIYLFFNNFEFITLKKINQAVIPKVLVTRALLKNPFFHYSTQVFKKKMFTLPIYLINLLE